MMSERNRKNNNTPISFEITIKKLIPYNTRISTKEFEIVHTNFQKNTIATFINIIKIYKIIAKK